MEEALKVYHTTKSVGKTVQKLGYPTRRQLYSWINNEGNVPVDRKQLPKVNNPTDHPRNPPAEIKLSAIQRCFELGESIRSVSEEIGYTRASIYQWRKRYLKEGAAGLMNTRNIQPGKLKEGKENISEDVTPSSKGLDDIKSQMLDMQMEIDILKETINVLKKDPGIDQTALKNREKVAIIDALKEQSSLLALLDKLDLSKSSYYYQVKILNGPDKYELLRSKVKLLFEENKKRYGYRRIYGLLKKEGIAVSEKIVRRIMKEEGLVVRIKRRGKYSSYAGEITPEVGNILERDFHTDKPNQKWLTDITEFAIPAGKIYLSPIVDCFDGLLVTWNISTKPNAALVNTMLDHAIATLHRNEHPILHSDRGCHYRWDEWIEKMEAAGLIRSMSKKGCSPDNSACEGVFGRLKNEMFYNSDWTDISIDEFINILTDYLKWYNEKRIKKSLGYMSPMEYRRFLGLAA